MNDAGSPGHLTRQQWVEKGSAAMFSGNFHLNLFSQPRLLLNFMDLKLIAWLNSPQFVIDNIEIEADKNKYTYEILDVKLFVQEYILHDAASSAIEQLLKQNRMITYPLSAVEMRSFFISGGRHDSPEFRLITSCIPKRVIMCLVDAESYLGTFKKTSFNFQHFNLRDATVECAVRSIPAEPLNLDLQTTST